ncbi:MAG: phenylalanine--tRNA ligase subunit alpha, partial [Oscillospiraceae bacterium]|nr:phenylalanine--tRNA ligase subunit alpha [Oscillospiraceae bacterium]
AEKIKEIREGALARLEEIADAAGLDELRVKTLGKKGELTALLKSMGSLPAEERPAVGQRVNELRSELEERLEKRRAEIKQLAEGARYERERIDVSLPGRDPLVGGRHPLWRVLEEIEEIFLGMGFDVVSGPEIEYDKYNFEMLRIPKGHPARDTQDTFYINESVLLRTQTSPVQVRTMLEQKPPIRVIAPGRVYRSDAVDATHSPIFHQIEGLVVDKGITMSDLKGTLGVFAKKLYGDDIKLRFRPHHFPFTEPSAEMDATCFKCRGKGCRMCKGEGYIELLGCGMVHPWVLSGCGIDPEVYSGFAFGMGLDRVTNFRYGIDDLRLLFENDLRFLTQF